MCWKCEEMSCFGKHAGHVGNLNFGPVSESFLLSLTILTFWDKFEAKGHDQSSS